MTLQLRHPTNVIETSAVNPVCVIGLWDLALLILIYAKNVVLMQIAQLQLQHHLLHQLRQFLHQHQLIHRRRHVRVVIVELLYLVVVVGVVAFRVLLFVHQLQLQLHFLHQLQHIHLLTHLNHHLLRNKIITMIWISMHYYPMIRFLL